MDILEKHFPDEDHVLVFDNATTHLKCAEGSVSALKMTKGPSANFGVEVSVMGENGKPVYAPDGKVEKKKVPMSNGEFEDGTVHEFYYPGDHDLAGQFKGMVVLLEERGFTEARKMKAQCGKKFSDCKGVDCCCRRTLYNQPDFVAGESLLEVDAREREQVWGYAKRRYRMMPPSSKDEDLERNLLASLEEVDVLTMRRFATRSLRFMDAYRKGLNGSQAAWAAKKYRGHRTIPESIMTQLEEAHIH